MPWQPPKINWTAQDKGNAADLNRQAGNIAHIATEVMPELGYHPAQTSIPTADRATLYRLWLANAIEGNLLSIETCGIPLPSGWGASKVWLPGMGSDWRDDNRWENNMLLMYEMAARIRAAWYYSGEIYSGEV